MTITLVFFYSLERLSVLYNLEEYQITETTKEYYYRAEDRFSSKQGLKVAAAITAYDDDASDIEDAEIGELKFYMKFWGAPELGSGFDFV